jgi:organic radical activating enzyme
LLWDVQYKPTVIVFSGGEPMMQQNALESVLSSLQSWGNECHVETAGTLQPTNSFDEVVAQYNVSPKLAHSGNALRFRRKDEVLRWFGQNSKAWFKFVLRTPDDFAEVDDIVSTCGILPSRVMVMPEGVTAQKNMAVAKTLVDGAIERGYGLSYRTHILLWKDVRGK